MSDITFGQQLGFLESGSDLHGMILSSQKANRYFGMMGQVPFFDTVLKASYFHIKSAPFNEAASFCFQRLQERERGLERKSLRDQNDFLGGFLKAKQHYPQVVNDDELVGYLLLNVRFTLTRQLPITYILLGPCGC